mmetsp:Transcript_40650/g.79184  ORF Transcript_40650/g.79184 Transcript_40650/m.79184 type:complete len:83 (-) Transcript_40650:193-441(-)
MSCGECGCSFVARMEKRNYNNMTNKKRRNNSEEKCLSFKLRKSQQGGYWIGSEEKKKRKNIYHLCVFVLAGMLAISKGARGG